jgi:hypothetical protein
VVLLLIAVPRARQRLRGQGKVRREGVLDGFGLGLTAVPGSPLTVSATMLAGGMFPIAWPASASHTGSLSGAGVQFLPVMFVRNSCSSCHSLRNRVHRSSLMAVCPGRCCLCIQSANARQAECG